MPPRPTSPRPIRVHTVEDLGDFGDVGAFGVRSGPDGTVFDDLFGLGHRPPTGGRRPRARPGDDVWAELTVPFCEAVTGTTCTVTVPGRDPVTVRIPPGTPSGRVLRVRGRGVPAVDGDGDLLVTVHVDERGAER